MIIGAITTIAVFASRLIFYFINELGLEGYSRNFSLTEALSATSDLFGTISGVSVAFAGSVVAIRLANKANEHAETLLQMEKQVRDQNRRDSQEKAFHEALAVISSVREQFSTLVSTSEELKVSGDGGVWADDEFFSRHQAFVDSLGVFLRHPVLGEAWYISTDRRLISQEVLLKVQKERTDENSEFDLFREAFIRKERNSDLSFLKCQDSQHLYDMYEEAKSGRFSIDLLITKSLKKLHDTDKVKYTPDKFEARDNFIEDFLLIQYDAGKTISNFERHRDEVVDMNIEGKIHIAQFWEGCLAKPIDLIRAFQIIPESIRVSCRRVPVVPVCSEKPRYPRTVRSGLQKLEDLLGTFDFLFMQSNVSDPNSSPVYLRFSLYRLMLFKLAISLPSLHDIDIALAMDRDEDSNFLSSTSRVKLIGYELDEVLCDVKRTLEQLSHYPIDYEVSNPKKVQKRFEV